MIRVDHSHLPTASTCCICDRSLSGQETHEVASMLDEPLYGEIYCRTCLAEQRLLCRECSGRYTVDGLCDECAAREYRLVG